MLYHREGSVNLDDLIKIELFEILNPKFKKINNQNKSDTTYENYNMMCCKVIS